MGDVNKSKEKVLILHDQALNFIIRVHEMTPIASVTTEVAHRGGRFFDLKMLPVSYLNIQHIQNPRRPLKFTLYKRNWRMVH